MGNVEATAFQQCAPTPTVEFSFAARDVHPQAPPQFTVPIEVFGGDGFFEPIGVELRHGAAHIERIMGRIGVVGVDHKTIVIAHTTSDRLDQAHIVFGAKADLHLGGLKAHAFDRSGLVGEPSYKAVRTFGAQHHAVAVHLNPVAMSPTDQLIERHARDFARNVPQRNVDTGQ